MFLPQGDRVNPNLSWAMAVVKGVTVDRLVGWRRVLLPLERG